MRHLGFPLDSELSPGKTVIYVDPDVGMRSCTKGGGDLNSLEFCLDDFPPADARTESISTIVHTPQLPPEPIHTSTSTLQMEQGEGSTLHQDSIAKNNSLIVNVHEKSHENTQNENILDKNLDPDRADNQDASDSSPTLVEQSASLLASDRAYQSSASGVLDVNAQEFIPGNASVSEGLSTPNEKSTSASVSLSASAKEFVPSSSYLNSSPMPSSTQTSENEVEVRRCARCNKVRYIFCVNGI